MSLEKEIAKMMAEMKKQGIESSGDIDAFMQQMVGKSFDDLPERTDDKGRSQDLVFEAYEQTVTQGKKTVKKALELDPDNTDAYVYLASIEKDLNKAILMYEKAIAVGEKLFGKKFFKENEGYFWGLVETRPYMRALAGLADCLYAKGEDDKTLAIYERMMKLNPNDNQGIRYLYSTLLLSTNDLIKFKVFIKSSEEEDSAVWTYNIALYRYKNTGQSARSDRALQEAYKSNKHVIDYMLGVKELPEQQPRYVGRGDENEAVAYVNGSWKIWNDTPGALDWLYLFKLKMN